MYLNYYNGKAVSSDVDKRVKNTCNYYNQNTFIRQEINEKISPSFGQITLPGKSEIS